jgi:hypothetical protein
MEHPMSFREKTAWIMLLSTLGVYGVYFFAFGRAWMSGQGAGFGLFAPMIATVVVLAIVQIVLSIGAAALSPSDARAPLDERERLIDLNSARAGFVALQSGVFLALVAVALGIAPALAANLLLAVMVAGEATRSIWRIAAYRLGAA